MPVAVKAREEAAGSAEPAAIARFKREFRALASLAHPHLVVLHEFLYDGPLAQFGFDGPIAGGAGAWRGLCQGSAGLSMKG